MSDVIENTFSTLSRLLNEKVVSNVTGSTMSESKVYKISKGFENFIRTVCIVKNKHDEDSIVNREINLLKQRFGQPDVTPSQMREYMVRVIFCSLLGYDVSFAGIHALKLAQHGNLHEKRTGYLAASLLLHEDQELILLLMNTIQKDLSSSNFLENCMGLTAVNQLVNSEMTPMLLPSVIEKLRHPRAIVRKKAVMCLQKCLHRSPESVQHMSDKFRQCLCDKDPSVMAVSLHIYLQLIQADPIKHADLTTGFVSTLRQVITRKLPSDLDYYSVPAPWIQIKLLKILAALGEDNEHSSSLMYGVLKETLERATVKETSAFAILFECIITMTTIWPNKDLLYTAASVVGKFLQSKKNNLRYVGLKALSYLVRCGAEYVCDYQMIVVDCLEDADHSIQKQTYDLLYRMTNVSNVQVICKRLFKYLEQLTDDFLRRELINNIIQLIEKFPPDLHWYINSMNEVLEMDAEKIPFRCSQSLLETIQKGCDTSASNYQQFRQFVCNVYIEYLQKLSLPTCLLNIAVWVTCEYCLSLEGVDSKLIMSHLIRHFQKSDVKSQYFILSGLQKLLFSGQLDPGDLQEVLPLLESSTKGHNLKQRLNEISRLVTMDVAQRRVLTIPNGGGKGSLDFTLSFLDDYVSEAIEEGGIAYRPKTTRFSNNKKQAELRSLFGEIQYDQYSSSVGSPGEDNSPGRSGIRPTDGSTDSTQSGSGSGGKPKLRKAGVKKVWGPGGASQSDFLPSVPMITDQKSSPIIPHPGYKEEDKKIIEEKKKKEELAAALFAGLGTPTSQNSPKPAFAPLMKDGLESNMAANEVQNEEETKLFMKGKNIGSHDWRTFKKPVTDLDPSSVISINKNAEVQLQSPTQAKMDNSQVLVKDNMSELRSTAEQPLPKLLSETAIYSSENTVNSELPSSMYSLMLSELTQEELSELSSDEKKPLNS